jgi:hypothetical protein
MHENKFEKEVREKMDHFGFDPSEAVWAGVEKEINKGKKDRRPLFWLFFFSGLALLGGGIYFTGYKYFAGPNPVSYEKQEIEKNPEKKSGAEKLIKADNTTKLDDAGNVSSNESAGQTTNQPELKGGYILKNNRKSEIILKSGKFINGPDNVPDNKKEEIKQTEESEIEDSGILRAENNRKTVTESSLASAQVTKAKISLTDSASDAKKTGKEIQHSKKHSWEIGFFGDAGISSANQTLFKPTNTTAYPYAPLSSGPGAINTTTVPTSAISPGFSFGAGAFVIRDLSKRISFQAGIGYHYYSTKINTGKAVNGPVYTFSTNAQGLIANSFYPNGNDREYTNQYHFVDLPLTINFQLNKSMHTPLIWQAGFSISYLVNSNALYFDPLSNVYFENSQQFNRTQLNATTALLIGFNLHNSTIQIGPLLQYGLTGLSKNGAGVSEHLLYYGVGISFIPGKK